MFCKFCGKQIPDGAAFCPECGKPANTSANSDANANANANANAGTNTNANYQSVQSAPNYNFQQGNVNANVNRERDSLAGSVLTFAILGLAFASTFCLSFLGLIFSCISRSKINNYCLLFGNPHGKAKVGNILGKVGLILSIVLTAIFTLYLFIFVILLGSI